MAHTVEVEIDDLGGIHPLQPDAKLPAGRALLTWPTSEKSLGYLLSEKSLAEDWLRPEEDAAWAYLQPEK